jgi:hypothetical protein
MPALMLDMSENGGRSGNQADSTAEDANDSKRTEPDGGQHMKLEDGNTTIAEAAARRQEQNGTEENLRPQLEIEDTGVRASAPTATTDTNTSRGPPYCILPEGEKIFIMLLVSFAAIISPISSSIYFPALNNLAKDLNVSISLINITITTYLVGNRPIEREQSTESY